MKTTGLKNSISIVLLTMAIFCVAGCIKHEDVENGDITVPTGAVKGLYSVSETQKVFFSRGNLQYQASTNMWRFVEHQWDFVGGMNRQDSIRYGNVFESGVQCDNVLASSDYAGWIDLFGWGTSGWNSGAICYQPYSTSGTDSDYYPGGNCENNLSDEYANADWGVYNAIINGGNQAGQWRTLSNVEWKYVAEERTTLSGIRYAEGQVNGVCGMILLPDDWNTSDFELNNTNNREASFVSNVISGVEWSTVFEPAGAVFLPAAGCRFVVSAGTYFDYIDHMSHTKHASGQYWSSSSYGGLHSWLFVIMHDNYYDIWGQPIVDNRRVGRSVRLVQSCNL